MTEHRIPGQLSEADILTYIRLSRTEKLEPVTFRRLMNLHGEPHAALNAMPELSARGGRSKAFKALSAQAAKREYDATPELGGTFLILGTKLSKASGTNARCPACHVVLRPRESAYKPALAIVGARNASTAGQRIAGKLAKDIGARALSSFGPCARH